MLQCVYHYCYQATAEETQVYFDNYSIKSLGAEEELRTHDLLGSPRSAAAALTLGPSYASSRPADADRRSKECTQIEERLDYVEPQTLCFSLFMTTITSFYDF